LNGAGSMLKQHVALFHVVTFLEHPLQHHAGDPGAHFGDARCGNAPAEFAGDGQGLGFKGFDPHLGQWCLGGLTRGLATRAQRQCQGQQARRRKQILRHAHIPILTGASYGRPRHSAVKLCRSCVKKCKAPARVEARAYILHNRRTLHDLCGTEDQMWGLACLRWWSINRRCVDSQAAIAGKPAPTLD